jgi:hypothetical protein
VTSLEPESGCTRIETGVDDGGTSDTADDGVLGPTEIDRTVTECNSPGPTGASGAMGATGATGALGAEGAIGTTGATGAQGQPGGPTGPMGATGATGTAVIATDGLVNGFFETGDLSGWDATDFNRMVSDGSQIAGNFTPEFNFNPTHGVWSTLRQFVDLRHTQFTLPKVTFDYFIPPNPNLTSLSLRLRTVDVSSGFPVELLVVFGAADAHSGRSGTAQLFIDGSIGLPIIVEILWESEQADPTGATIQIDNVQLVEGP